MNKDKENNGAMTKECKNRLLRDIMQIMKSPLTDNGIYYSHCEENVMKGYALIIGPKDTPYFSGFYFFMFDFPYDYPFSPPTVTYMTNNGSTRFHPNFYKNGKVCVSILNTWAGEKWSSCQSISSVLLTLCSLFTENPLLNEPSITLQHKDVIPYSKTISFVNLHYSFCEMTQRQPIPFSIFREIILELFLKNYEEIYQKVLLEIENNNNEEIIVQIYLMTTQVNYNLLKEKLEKTKELIKYEKIEKENTI
jgi:ubiquitin-conjugating enzyme E2 Z